jgi:hypothetical protein
MPSRFPASVHNAPAAQVAIAMNGRGLNAVPTAGEISFECALWLAMRQLAVGEADVALAGAVDELNKYLLCIGRRWGLWTDRTRPGEGAVVAALSRLRSRPEPPLARVTAVCLGRYRRPFDPESEVRWIESVTDLADVDILLSGAGGWPVLEPHYAAVAEALNRRFGRVLEHRTYKPLCGEYYAASAFGFSRAVEWVRNGSSGVLLYTLSPRGFKALCCVRP